MNKHILLLLLITSSLFTYAMEKESFAHLSEIMSPKKSKKKGPLFQFDLPFLKLTMWPTSEIIATMRANKDDFEEMLARPDKQIKKAIKKQQDLRKIFTIINNSFPQSSTFLKYCYHQELHEQIGLPMNDIKNLDHCKGTHTHFCGYSALGAAMLAKNVSTEKKRAFIQTLINYGFEPLAGDIELANLIVYDNTMHYRNLLLHVSYTKTLATWSTLPQEVRAYIAHYLLLLANKESALLPDCYTHLTTGIEMPDLLYKFSMGAHIRV